MPTLEPEKDILLTFPMLAGRWSCNVKVAGRRVKKLGLPVVKWNKHAVAVRLSDVLKAEQEATVV